MPYWFIDILQMQVTEACPGQYFAVKEHSLRKTLKAAIKQKHVNVVLKLNCYKDVSLDEEAAVNFSLKQGQLR